MSEEEYVGALVFDQGTAIPSIDMGQPIVRCRDCKRAEIDYSEHEYREPLWCGFHRMDVKPGNFCSWGKRRGDAE